MKRILTLAALSAAFFTVPALAQPAPMVSQPVVTAGLDLTDPDDVARLDRRIAIAARAACGTASSVDPEGKNALRRCRAEARESAAIQRARAIAAAREASAATLAARD